VRSQQPQTKLRQTKQQQVRRSRLISIADRHKAKQIAVRIGVWAGRIAMGMSMAGCFVLVTRSEMIGIRHMFKLLFLPKVYWLALLIILLIGIAIGGWWGKSIAQNLIQKLHKPLWELTTKKRLKAAIASGAIVLIVGSAIAALIFYGLILAGVLIAFAGIDESMWLVAIALLLICPGFVPAILITRTAIVRAIRAALPEIT
jgi:hypothetical protein